MKHWLSEMMDILLTSFVMVTVSLVLFILAVKTGILLWVLKKVREILRH